MFEGGKPGSSAFTVLAGNGELSILFSLAACNLWNIYWKAVTFLSVSVCICPCARLLKSINAFY